MNKQVIVGRMEITHEAIQRVVAMPLKIMNADAPPTNPTPIPELTSTRRYKVKVRPTMNSSCFICTHIPNCEYQRIQVEKNL
jgi:hypothetical protein